jgi:uncharacterized membrane protein
MSWLFLSLAAPIFWAIGNYLDKFALEKYTKSTVDFLFFNTLMSWIFVPLLILYFGMPSLSFFAIIPIILGALMIYSYSLYAKALEVGETSSLMPLMGLIPVFTIIFGYFFLGQALTHYELICSAIIITGAFLTIIEKFSLKILIKPGVGWMLLSNLLLSILFILFSWVLIRMPFEEFIVLDTLGTGCAGLLLLLHPTSRKKVVQGIKTAKTGKYFCFGLNNTLGIFGQMSIKKAFALAPTASLVTVLIQIQSFYLIVLGLLFTLIIPHYISEDISKGNLSKKILGVSLIFIGIALLVKTGGY